MSRIARALGAALVLSAFAVSAFAEQAPPAPAPSGNYVADIAHTSLTWRIGHWGLSSYTARFTGVSADLDWNAADPAKSTLSVSVDPKSVRTDFPFPEKEDFDAKIGTGEDFLAGKPILFRSTSIEVTGDNVGKVTGDLTFRGQTHPATLNVTFNGSMAEHPLEKTAKLGFSATGKIRRADWGLVFGGPALGEEVTLTIEAEFAAAK